MKSAIVDHQNNNDETLRFLRDQDFSSAVKSGTLALRCHRLQFPEDILSDTDAYDCLDQCMLLSELNASENCETSHGFIYRHGIMLQPTMTDTQAITAVLIFNTALAHHLLAVQHHQYQVLPKARRLYELAYNAYDMDHNILFQFAVINNILMIDRMVTGDNVNVSSECLDHLISLFMIMVHQGCDMHLRHVKGFLVNMSPNSQTAVAA